MPLSSSMLAPLIKVGMIKEFKTCTSSAVDSTGKTVVTYPFDSASTLAATGVDSKTITYNGVKMTFTDALAEIVSKVVADQVVTHITTNAVVNSTVNTVAGQLVLVTIPAGTGATTTPGTGTGVGTIS